MSYVKSAIFGSLIMMLISSCTTFQKQATVTNIVYDTIRVHIDNDNNLRRTGTNAIAGIPPTKRVVFTGPNQAVTFQQGDQLELISDGIDFGLYTFDIVTDDETDEVTIKVIDKEESKVVLTKMCQTIERMNIDNIPEVEISPDLSPQQIVITPIVNNTSDCSIVGYQVRYGTLERGCRKNQKAKEIYDNFVKCYPIEKSKEKKKVKPQKNAIVNKKHDCIEWILFGIECDE
jgi:hypothetical protein